MKKIMLLCIYLISSGLYTHAQEQIQLLEEIDRLTEGKPFISKSQIVIYGERGTRTMEAETYSTDNPDRSYTEYLSPARDRGTKMLKIGPQMWIYSPANDRITAISGHLLRQSVMGTDLSYEDLMDDRDLADRYTAKDIGTETIDNHLCHVYELTAKVKDIAYPTQKIWADLDKKVFLKVEMYSKSKKLLKVAAFSDFKYAQNRWKPTKIHFKDMQKRGKGTDVITLNYKLETKISEDVFNKSNLKK